MSGKDEEKSKKDKGKPMTEKELKIKGLKEDLERFQKLMHGLREKMKEEEERITQQLEK